MTNQDLMLVFGAVININNKQNNLKTQIRSEQNTKTHYYTTRQIL